jgi:uncharacterized OB-fold protein
VREGLFTDEGLLGGRCTRCGQRHFPRATTCPWCGSDTIDDVTLSTEGTLWSWTAVSAAPPGYEGDVPYGFGVVELPADNLQVVTRITEADTEALAQGMAMRFVVVPLTATTTTYAFEPVG